MTEKKIERKTIAKYSGLTWKDYLYYSIADFGICLVFGCANSLLQKYYSDCLGFNPLFILVIFLIARVWDAINDVLMGRICDRIKPGKNGKYRRYLLWMCGPLAIASVLMFAQNANSVDVLVESMGSNWFAYVIAGITYILFGMSLTAIQIPYSSLANVVTLDAHERGKLSIWRGVMGHIGGIPCLAVKAYSFFPAQDTNHRPCEWEPLIIGVSILAVCTVGFLLMAYFGTKERYTSKPVAHNPGSMKKALSRIVHSRSLLSICVASAVVACGGMFMTGYSSYVVSDYFQMAGWRQTLPDFANISAIFLIMIITPLLAKKFGKKETVVLGLVVNTIIFTVMLFLRLAGASETVYWIYVTLNFIAGLGSALFSMLMWGMVADAIDDMEVEHGEREDGTAISIMMFFRKAGQCLCFVCINLSLIAMGRNIVVNWTPSPEQLTMCWNLGAIIPLICFGVGTLMFAFWFPISKKRLEEIQDKKEILLSKIEREKGKETK